MVSSVKGIYLPAATSTPHKPLQSDGRLNSSLCTPSRRYFSCLVLIILHFQIVWYFYYISFVVKCCYFKYYIILMLFNCIATVRISTAACERGFSRMNIIYTSLRSQLSPENLAAFMFVSLSVPRLPSWNPLPYVKTSLAINRRDATIACPLWRSNLRLNAILL